MRLVVWLLLIGAMLIVLSVCDILVRMADSERKAPPVLQLIDAKDEAEFVSYEDIETPDEPHLPDQLGREEIDIDILDERANGHDRN